MNKCLISTKYLQKYYIWLTAIQKLAKIWNTDILPKFVEKL